MLNWVKQKINSWIEKREKIAEAKQVYRNCRGTHHKEILEQNINKLEELISKKQNKRSKKNKERRKIRNQLNQKINKKAFRQYFKENYDSIEGIGDKYSNKILQKIARTSNSQWSDLEHMGNKIINQSKHIKGIGQKTHSALKNWHYHNRDDIKKLSDALNGDEGVYSSEKEKIQELRQNASDLKKEIENLEELKKKPEKALRKLQRTSVDDFIQANLDPKKNAESAEKVNEYMKGFYPEWGDPPPWYEEVQTVLKDRSTESLQTSDKADDLKWKRALKRIKQKS